MQVYVLTHHNGLYSRGPLGVFSKVDGAKIGALNDARRALARGVGGAENLEWRENYPGGGEFNAVTGEAVYSIRPKVVVSGTPRLVGVDEARIEHRAALVVDGSVPLDWWDDDPAYPAICQAVEGAQAAPA